MKKRNIIQKVTLQTLQMENLNCSVINSFQKGFIQQNGKNISRSNCKSH